MAKKPDNNSPLSPSELRSLAEARLKEQQASDHSAISGVATKKWTL